jgi:predicted CoA-binding protein
MTVETDEAEIPQILAATRVIALVGVSPDPRRDANDVMAFLKRRGFRVIPVNPLYEGEMIHGEKVVASLKDIDVPIDLVDVFRRAEAVGPIVVEAIAVGAKAVWLQLRIVNDEACKKARAAGLKFVQNRCTKVEVSRHNITPPAE